MRREENRHEPRFLEILLQPLKAPDMTDLKALCTELEHYETPKWAADEILRHELLTEDVVDPCTGTGVLAFAAQRAGHFVTMIDIEASWAPGNAIIIDWLALTPETAPYVRGKTVFMNPPFTQAAEFFLQALRLGARKIVCFQRLTWYESETRRDFWDKYPPNRIYLCGSRATCWRHDVPADQRGSGTPTAHAWFVWERGQAGSGTQLLRIYKDKSKPS